MTDSSNTAALEPEGHSHRLPTTSQYRALHAIVNRQISDPAALNTYITQIDEALTVMSGFGPHDLILEERKLFATLYQAICNDFIHGFKISAEAHVTVVKTITKALEYGPDMIDPESLRANVSDSLEIAVLVDHPFGPNLTLYPSSTQSIPQQIVSYFLGEIRRYLTNNRHLNSFGTLLNAGISMNTKVLCCVFGSRTPDDFTAPTELVCEGITLPVLIMRNWICESATSMSPPPSWINKPVCQTEKIDLSGQSIGHHGDMQMSGSFGFFGIAQGILYGISAEHNTPRANQGSIIVSPSTQELTGRLMNIVPYTKFSSKPLKRIPRLDSEVQSLLESGLSQDSEDGCEIIETLDMGKVRRRKIILNGPKFGTVVRTSATHKDGVLEKHNRRLDKQGANCFALPYNDAGFGEQEGCEGCSRIEWCCFEVAKERFGKNRLNSDTNQDDDVRDIDLLKPDMKVSKIGRTTGKTRGTVNGCIVQRWSGDLSQKVTMEIGVLGDNGKGFAELGDSGSLVTAGEVIPYGVGMVIGKDCSNTLVLVTPLWAILEDIEDRLRIRVNFST